jgi:7,8-dihydropterin-6-yl-methyl-4-(beta-D-ribofuranosyl)aminobenzene 5'-phosphate synthase
MISNLKVTIIVNNISETSELKSEHGLSIWVEADERKFLFDTGQSDILIHNAEQLGIDLATADSLILSHGHYDHTGGVEPVTDRNSSIAIYCNSGVFIPRYSRQSDGRMKPIGITKKSSEALHKASGNIHWVDKPIMLADDIGITGPIPRVTDFEDTGGNFFYDLEGTKPDTVSDDLAVWLQTSKGLCVLTGCCHSGLVNTLKYISSLTGQASVHSVIGGFHLLNASSERMENTCEYLHDSDVNWIVPCHCTGENAVEYLRSQFNDRIQSGRAGSNIIIS